MFKKTVNPIHISTHAICVASGLRDGMRTAHYYVRDLHRRNAQAGTLAHASIYPIKSMKSSARVLDTALTRGGNAFISLFAPNWRRLPSPFAPETTAEVLNAIRERSLFQSQMFNIYFFRSCKVLLAHWADPPNLVLEHRIDIARRNLAEASVSENQTTLMARILMSLVEAMPIAKHGALKPESNHFKSNDIAIAVCASSCIALLLAQRGSAVGGIDDKGFLSVVGALIAPRLEAIDKACKARDLNQLTLEFSAVSELY